MTELLRFCVLRPAKPADPSNSVPVQATPDLVKVIASANSVVERLRLLIDRPVNASLGDYRFGEAMAALGVWAQTVLFDRATALKKLDDLTKEDPAALTHAREFGQDVTQLDDTLLTLKYRSQALGINIEALKQARLGYDLVEQLAGKAQPRIRHLLSAIEPTPAPKPKDSGEVPPPPADDLDARIAHLAEVRTALRNAIRGGLVPSPVSEQPLARTARSSR